MLARNDRCCYIIIVNSTRITGSVMRRFIGTHYRQTLPHIFSTP